MEADLIVTPKSGWLRYPALILSALCLLIPAFYNHFPLVNPDTAVYINSGFVLENPSDRPIVYGLLIYLFSLRGLSLWFIIFAQSYILSWLIFKVVRQLSGVGGYIVKSMAITLLLSIGTGVSWVACQVQPDLFTSMAYLCMALLLIDKAGRRGDIVLYILFFVCVCVHLSHPSLIVGSLLVLWLFRRLYAGAMSKRITRKIGTMIILSLAAILVMGTPLAKSKHVFLVGSLLQKGVLKTYLDDSCATKQYELCKYKDGLTTDSDEFLWNPESPLYKMGGWKAVKPEFNTIIYDIRTNPKYLGQFALATAKQTVQQAAAIDIGGGNTPFTAKDNVYLAIQCYLPGDLPRFKADRQNSEDIREAFVLPNKLFTIVVIACILALFYILTKWRAMSQAIRILLLVCITGIILNCVDCAAFGKVNGRYGAKMIWLVPFCIMVFVVGKNGDKTKTIKKG